MLLFELFEVVFNHWETIFGPEGLGCVLSVDVFIL